MAEQKGKAKDAIAKAKDFLKKTVKTIKFLATPIGYVLCWIFLIIFIIILFTVLVKMAVKAIEKFLGYDWNYSTYKKDLAVIQQLNVSGYESAIDAENFQDYKAYEYAVLLDAAEYIRNTKQEMFDIVENEGEYIPERNLIKNRKSDEYNARIAELSQQYANVGGGNSPTSAKLMNINYNTNQSKLSSSQLQSLIDSSADARNVKVSGIDEGGSIRGGNNRVNGPFLVYEFRSASFSGDNGNEVYRDRSGDSSGDETASYTSVLSGDTVGSVEPYIYVTRDNVEFSYYFNANNQVIEYPFLLNVYNGNLTKGTENSAEINRALLGVSPVVFPDENYSNYTSVPYYSSKTTSITYKIPLRTIIGRYMPKAELLNAWSYVKQSVERDTEDTQVTNEPGIMDYTIEAIKGIYNEACLLGEDIQVIHANNSGENAYYTQDNSHRTTFVTFEKAGIESTKYDINGLQPIGGEDGEANIRLVTNFISAVVVDKEFDVDYKATTVTADPNTPAGQTTPSPSSPATQPQNQIVTTTEDTIHISLSDLSISGVNLQAGNYILAEGSPESGYTPPSSVEGEDGYYVRTTDPNEAQRILSAIRTAVINYISSLAANAGATIEITSLPESIVNFNPIFLAERTAHVTQKLKIEHIRMPILLVKSANTWCRQVTYQHTIVQNHFKQNDKKYIIPKSVSSIGLESFNTTTESNRYRGKAYSEVFSRIQEKDVINMLLVLETAGNEGMTDSYEYMRDLYKLIIASRDYSNENGHTDSSDSRFIHEDTFKYVYIPDSILYYDDSQSQKIYWLDLLTATEDDPITKDELNNIRTKDKEITWQLVEYEKYDECNSSGNTKVYALNPFGSQYARTYFETMYKKGLDVKGDYKAGEHNGADWGGRGKINDILEKSNSANSTDNIGDKIYQYELKRLSDVYGEQSASEKLKNALSEEKANMPIVAVAPGKVINVQYSSRMGFCVEILHSSEEQSKTYYMHLKRWPLVNIGDYVGAGTLLGYEGCTGRSFGSHLHFQVMKNGSWTSPAPFIFPSFNPFYYEEKAAEVNYDLGSEYMSLQRTVSMLGNDSNSVSQITNKVPEKILVEDYNTLIQKQGSIEERKEQFSGDWEQANNDLDWSDSIPAEQTARNYQTDDNIQLAQNKDNQIHTVRTAYLAGNDQLEGSTIKKYVDNLKNNKKNYDLFLTEALFDKQLAMAEGYLQNPMINLTGDIIVKTDLPGALPELTKSDLKIMLEGYLNAKYKNYKMYGTNMTKVQWIMKNIFSDANIDYMLQKEKETKVSIVFMIAVAIQEQSLGTANNRLSRVAHNIFSIKGSYHGRSIEYQAPGRMWRSYPSYKDAIGDFMDLIAYGKYYYQKGRYTIGTIGPVYCGTAWVGHVSQHVRDLMQYYPGTWTDPGATDGTAGEYNSKAWLDLCGRGVKWLYKNGFGYSFSGGYIPYKSRGADGSWNGKRASAIDCSTYVSWMLYEYGVEHNIAELKKFGDRDSGRFQALASSIQKSPNSGVNKCFTTVFCSMKGLKSAKTVQQIHDLIQPGDIFIYRKATGHVEVFAGWVDASNKSSSKIYKYSCGMAPRTVSSYKNGKPYSYNMGRTSGGHGWWDLTAIIRIKGLATTSSNATNNGSTTSNTSNGSTTSNTSSGGVNLTNANSASDAFMQVCGKTASYIAQYHFKYGVGGFGQSHYLGEPGSFGTPRKAAGKRIIDCIGYVRWSVYEYAVANNIEGLKDNVNLRNPNCSFHTFQNAAKGTGYLSKWFDPVYYNGGKYISSTKQFKELLKPGDIMIWMIKGKTINGKTYTADHIDIFAGWASNGQMLVYAVGDGITQSDYGKNKYYKER